jgi:hypothetical protein
MFIPIAKDNKNWTVPNTFSRQLSRPVMEQWLPNAQMPLLQTLHPKAFDAALRVLCNAHFTLKKFANTPWPSGAPRLPTDNNLEDTAW